MKTLKEKRLLNQYSYQDMANLLHISKTYYWQIENNKRRLSYSMALKIAQIFDTTPDILFYQETVLYQKRH